jgi:hypothetical protein
MGSGLDDWIYWHSYYNYYQITAHNQWLRLAPFLTGPRVSSLPLCDEWRTTNPWTLWRMSERWLTNESLIFARLLTVCLVSMEIIGWLSVSVENVVESSLTRNMLIERLPSNGLFSVYLFQRECVFGEPLASNGLPLWLYYSHFQASQYRNETEGFDIFLLHYKRRCYEADSLVHGICSFTYSFCFALES